MDGCQFEECGGEIFAGDLCGRHYAQKRRGTLGKEPARAANNEGERVTIRLDKSMKARVEAAAHTAREAVSKWCRDAVLQRLDKPKKRT